MLSWARQTYQFTPISQMLPQYSKRGDGVKSVKPRKQDHDQIPSYLMLWNTGAVKHRSCEAKELWNTVKVKHWSFETQELWYTGAVKQSSSEKLEKIFTYFWLKTFHARFGKKKLSIPFKFGRSVKLRSFRQVIYYLWLVIFLF